MVGRDRIAQEEQRPSVRDRRHRRRGEGEITEERRFGNVGRWRPVVDVAARRFDGVPEVVVRGEILVEALEDLGVEREGKRCVDLFARRLEVAQKDRLPGAIRANRLAGEVDVDAPGKRKRNHEGR